MVSASREERSGGGHRMGEVRAKVRITNAVDDAIVLGNEVLIGQTVLEKLNLLMDCDGQRLVPNPRRPANRI